MPEQTLNRAVRAVNATATEVRIKQLAAMDKFQKYVHAYTGVNTHLLEKYMESITDLTAITIGSAYLGKGYWYIKVMNLFGY